jgi:hypothetical protein
MVSPSPISPPPAEWRWEKLEIKGTNKPVGRVGHTSVLHGQDSIYMFGGYGDDGYSDDLNRLDLKSGTWSVVEVCLPPSAGPGEGIMHLPLSSHPSRQTLQVLAPPDLKLN